MAKISESPWRLALTTGVLLVATLMVYWIVYASSAVTDQATKTATHGDPRILLITALLVVFLAAAGAVVLAKMLWDEIDLSKLVAEANGDASMSRFQFLIFTFVIAGSYFLMVVWSLTATKSGGGSVLITNDDGTLNMPNIPPGVLGLIGISGGSYLVSKGIQKTAEAGAGSSVTGVTVTAGGTGYSPATKVAFSGGGMGTTGTVTVSNGAVTGVTITAGGSGYVVAPTVAFTDPGTSPGSGATATATIG
ncbi:MAG TPA: hypothetical protein VNW90_25740 [Acetobacteraceae bacterium]|nr:hypothetical protein [Acetobacteraceae bacterium]